jgi:hypothetical protein
MMLDNTSYNKIKLLYKLSALSWFIEKHAKPDAQQAGDAQCQEMLNTLHKDIQQYLERLQKTMCIITQ